MTRACALATGWVALLSTGCPTPVLDDDPIDTDTDTDTDTDVVIDTDTDTDVVDTDALDAFDYAAAPVTVTLPAGSFTMGSPEGEVGRTSVETALSAEITYAFAVSIHEITQGQYAALVGETPSYWTGCRRCPVERVSWHDAVTYVNALSTQEGLDACYTCTSDAVTGRPQCVASAFPARCSGYRLPLEVEWEYAARAAGTEADATPAGGSVDDPLLARSCDPVAGTSPGADPDTLVAIPLDDGTHLTDQAWFCANSDGTPGRTTRKVGRLAPNASGLYDLVGNVYEWTADWWADQALTDVLPEDRQYRTIRGGGWNSRPAELRSGFRTLADPNRVADNLGFRVARTIDVEE